MLTLIYVLPPLLSRVKYRNLLFRVFAVNYFVDNGQTRRHSPAMEKRVDTVTKLWIQAALMRSVDGLTTKEADDAGD